MSNSMTTEFALNATSTTGDVDDDDNGDGVATSVIISCGVLGGLFLSCVFVSCIKAIR